MTVCNFAGIMSHQLISNAEYLSRNQQTVFHEEAVVVRSTSTTSPITEVSSMTAAEMGITGKVIIRQLRDSNNNEHFLVKYETTTDPSGRKSAKARACKVCQAEGR